MNPWAQLNAFAWVYSSRSGGSGLGLEIISVIGLGCGVHVDSEARVLEICTWRRLAPSRRQSVQIVRRLGQAAL